MLELVAKHGAEFKSPSYHEITMIYLKQQVEKDNLILEAHPSIYNLNLEKDNMIYLIINHMIHE